jgi:leucine-rich repeat/fibronectin type-III domain-containing protein 5
MRLSAVLVSLALLAPRAARSQCDTFCTCIDGLLADCTAREALDFRFTGVPSVLPPTTRELILTSNNISNLSTGAFSHLPDLETLRLDKNQLSSLSAAYFDSLPQLQTLILDENPLQQIDSAGVFANLTSLLELSIQITPLSQLNGAVFQGLSTLTTLKLDQNQLFNLSTDFLEHLPALTLLSVTGNELESLPDGFLDGAPVTTVQLDLHDNPWSCDCRLQWLANFTSLYPDLISSDETQCLWPPHLVDSPINGLSSGDYQCNAPSITQQPQNDSILTDAPYSLEIVIDGAPFPDVTWTRDGTPVNYTERVFVSGYDASLLFALVTNDDAGIYGVSLSNIYGEEESVIITLMVTESTCVDGDFTDSHETDVDCGGQYCSPCLHGMGCLVDGDCVGELVCLYGHQLPSQLHYLSPYHPIAFTCANASVPESLLQSLISATSDLPLVVSGNSTRQEIEDSFHSFIAEVLSVPRAALTGVRVSSVERHLSPLLQFEAQVVGDCEAAAANLNTQIDRGSLKATVKTSEGQGRVCYNVRLNI